MGRYRPMTGPVRALGELAVSFSNCEVLVLCHHQVRSRERFHAQMSVLLDRKYSFVTLEQFTRWLRRKAPMSSPAIVLTFDGGYRSQLENALPTLEALNLSATFFPLSAALDEVEVNRHDLTALVSAGHTIGCHTETHPDLTGLSSQDLEREVSGSKRTLEDALGHQITAFCYPNGLRNSRVVAAVQRAGFDVAFTIDLGGVRPSDDPYQLKRIAVLGEPSPRQFSMLVNGTRFIAGGVLIGSKLRERVLEYRARLRAK